VDKQLISSIGKGILVFAAVAPGDTETEIDALAGKVLKMRLWDDDAGGRVWPHLQPLLGIWRRKLLDGFSIFRNLSILRD
jgi:D-aminoacyl-tRNA deacylase